MVLTGSQREPALVIMFERFTNRARHVVVLAQEEARRLQHNYIGTEHLLLGLLGEPDGLAGRVLERIGMSLDSPGRRSGHRRPRQEAERAHPFTPRAKKILELSLREALQLHHNYIGTEHILLGVIREGDGVGAQILRPARRPAGDPRRARPAARRRRDGRAGPSLAAPRRRGRAASARRAEQRR